MLHRTTLSAADLLHEETESFGRVLNASSKRRDNTFFVPPFHSKARHKLLALPPGLSIVRVYLRLYLRMYM